MNWAAALGRICLQTLRDCLFILLKVKPLFLNGKTTTQINKLQVREVIGKSQGFIHPRQQVLKGGDVRAQVNVGSRQLQIEFAGNRKYFRQFGFQHADAALSADEYVILGFFINIQAYSHVRAGMAIAVHFQLSARVDVRPHAQLSEQSHGGRTDPSAGENNIV